MTLALALLLAAGAQDADRVDALIRQLDDDELAVRHAAQAALEKLGKPALPALREAGSGGTPEVRTRALAAIETIEWAPGLALLARECRDVPDGPRRDLIVRESTTDATRELLPDCRFFIALRWTSVDGVPSLQCIGQFLIERGEDDVFQGIVGLRRYVRTRRIPIPSVHAACLMIDVLRAGVLRHLPHDKRCYEVVKTDGGYAIRYLFKEGSATVEIKVNAEGVMTSIDWEWD